MVGRIARTRPGRAGSVLILLSVMLLAGVGVVYVAEPAAATLCTPDSAMTLGAASQSVDGVTVSFSWDGVDPEYTGFDWTVTAPIGGTVMFLVDRSAQADESAGPGASGSYDAGGQRLIDALYACGMPEPTTTPSSPTSAGGVIPYVLDNPSNEGGNVTCAELGYATAGPKQDWPFGAGAFPGITVTVTGNTYVAWSTTAFAIYAVILHGGPAANIYEYDGSVHSDSGLAAPVNPGGNVPTLSNLTFCGDPVTPEPAQLTVVKETDPDGGTGFGFTPSGNLPGGGFSLDDDGSKVFSDLTAGTYSVSEDTLLPNEWQFDLVSCYIDGTQTPVGTPGDQGVSVTLAAGQHVTCTFYNSEIQENPARLTIRKVTEPSGGAGFGFTPSGNLPGGPFLLDDGEEMVYGNLEGGTYSVAETSQAPGWQFSSVSCMQVQVPVGTVDGAAATVTLEPGDDVVCTFVNVPVPENPPGHIIVRKVTIPSGESEAFEFDPSWGANFSLSDGGSHHSGPLPAGVYSVSEAAPLSEGWSLTSAVCSDGSSPAAIGLSPRETVTCTFTNTLEEEEVQGPKASLTIVKVVDGLLNSADAGALFSFDGGSLGGFQLADGDSETFSELDPGAYSVAEGALPASLSPPSTVEGSVGYLWHFRSVECTGASWSASGSSVTVNLTEGEPAVCTFYNYQEQVAGPELPYTGAPPFMMPLLIAGLWALVMGLGLVVWSALRKANAA